MSSSGTLMVGIVVSETVLHRDLRQSRATLMVVDRTIVDQVSWTFLRTKWIEIRSIAVLLSVNSMNMIQLLMMLCYLHKTCK